MAYIKRLMLMSLPLILPSNHRTTVDALLLNPVDNYCARFDHQSTVKDDTLYIFGGGQTYVDENKNGRTVGPITVGYNLDLISVDLSNSWDWKTNLTQVVTNVTANPKTGTLPPQLSQGSLFQGSPSDSSLYAYGGTTTWANTSFPGFEVPGPSTYSLWAYDTSIATWSQYDISLKVPYRPSSGAHAEAPDQSLAFYLNGELNNGSSEGVGLAPGVSTFLPGMVVVNTTDHTAKNLSTAGVTGTSPRARAQMQYISGIGEKGILVLLGGSSKALGEYGTTDLLGLAPMTDVAIFDVGSLYNSSTPDGIWYRQNATAATATNATNIPEPRVDFCLIGVAAADSSSYNIYMYGGRDDASNYFDEIWVLSLPSFTWTQVYSGIAPRFAHTCHLVGNRTLLTVGGIASITQKSGLRDTHATPCDWESKGLAVMDLTDITWGSVYEAHTPAYGVPTEVIGTIGGRPEGQANLTTPIGGFADDGLASLFGAKPAPNAGSSNKGLVLTVEIVAPICGITALLALGGLAWWWWLKDRVGRNRMMEEESTYYEKSQEPDIPKETVYYEKSEESDVPRDRSSATTTTTQ